MAQRSPSPLLPLAIILTVTATAAVSLVQEPKAHTIQATEKELSLPAGNSRGTPLLSNTTAPKKPWCTDRDPCNPCDKDEDCKDKKDHLGRATKCYEKVYGFPNDVKPESNPKRCKVAGNYGDNCKPGKGCNKFTDGSVYEYDCLPVPPILWSGMVACQNKH
ncbi:unnamed protein product [Vitrella brassicaformis CCMP3155]|uniref:Uncharacterized protein n=2 Tax=Vitrella brassicaformis TaxID=1169539 RepID=A0A0G4FKJ1_VITBC|nr:unnamed protein product [Vitrella brassicaformis CCMP3155]|mmetsp:Transcript_51652/g.129768  ORF Transcript_51652/g.129768 Transcript_51652/m.129768 type:complete len:162 (+) Transcript_51652:210-695(+)|eukprot:CEM14105.1 unnamed protein product [Vitrella brassicaformis CCMP3155]